MTSPRPTPEPVFPCPALAPPPLPFARVMSGASSISGQPVFSGTCRAPGEEVAVLVRIETGSAPSRFDLRLHYAPPSYDPELGALDVYLPDQGWDDVRIWLARYQLRDGWWPAPPPTVPPRPRANAARADSPGKGEQ